MQTIHTRAHLPLCILGLLLGVLTLPAHGAVDREKAQAFFEDGLAQFKAERYPEAVIQLRNALQLDANNLAARILLGRTLMRENQVNAAVSELEKALTLGGDENLILIPLAQSYLELLQPGKVLTGIVPEGHEPEVDGELLLLQGRAYLMLGNAKAAEEAFLAAGVLLPVDPRPLLGRADLALAKGRRNEVGKMMAQAVALSPDDFDVWIYKALIHRDAREYNEAIPAFERALELRPTSGRALTGRAAMWLDIGAIAEAERDLERATELEVDTLETIYLRTLILFRQGKQEEAREVLRTSADKIRSITEDARTMLPHTSLMLGVVAYFDGNYSEAIEHFRIFLAKSPSHLGAKRYLAAAYLALGEWEDLIKLYRPSPTSEPPNDPTALSMLAEAYRAKGNFKSAQRYYEAAIQLAPNSAGLAIRLAMSRLESGDAERALQDLNWLVEKFPQLVEARLQLAQVYANTGEIEKAKVEIQVLVDTYGDNSRVMTIAGAIYSAAGDLEAARKYTLLATRLDPDLILPQLNLARIARAEEHLASAESQYRSILLAHPKNVRALIELCRLQLAQGELEEAAELVQAVLDDDPASFEASLLKLEIQMTGEAEIEQIRNAAYELLKKFPEEPRADLFVGRMHLQLGETADAKRLFRHAGEKAQFDAEILLETAKLQIAIPDLNGALWTLTKANQGSPGHVEAATLRATVLIDLDDFEQSKDLLIGLREEHGDSASILSAEGHWHMAQGQYDEAIALFIQAHEKEQTLESVNALYRAHLAVGRTGDGIALLEEWVRAQPEDVTSRHRLAQGLIAAGRYGEALEVYEALRADGVEDVVLLNNLASMYQRLGDKRALATARLAYEQAPEVSSVLDTYGWILTENDKPEEGLALLREAFARYSTGPEIRYHIGLALLKIGKKEEAAEEFAASLEIDGHFADADRAEALLAELRPPR